MDGAYVHNNPINHVDPLGLANWMANGGEGQFKYFPDGPYRYYAADTLHEQVLANLANILPLAGNLFNKADQTIGPAGNFGLLGVTSVPQQALAAERSLSAVADLASTKVSAMLAQLGPKVQGALNAATAKLAPFTRQLRSEAGAIDIGSGEAVRDSAQITKNAQQGAAFEARTVEKLKETQDGVVQQITVRTETGVKTRLDAVGTDKVSGQVKLTEAKSSESAPLTQNQAAAYPEIERTGATVVGKGKPGFLGGTKIPPTKVDVIRPNEGQ